MSSEYNKDRAVHFFKTIQEMDNLCDVTLVSGIDQQKFSVHRVVMAVMSPYFNALLMSGFRERDQNEIPLPEIDGPTLKLVFDYCYCREIDINNENVERLIAAASSMELVELEKACSEFLIDKVEVDTCVDLLMVADRYNSKDLWTKAFACICKNLDRIASVDMVRLDEKNFERILRSDKITAAEDKVFHVFAEWVQHDESYRSKFVRSLSNLIKLEHATSECLSNAIEPFNVKHGCAELVIDEYRRRVCSPKPLRLHRSCGLCCATFAASDNSGAVDIYEFDEGLNDFSKTNTIKFQMRIEKINCSRGKIFAIGRELNIIPPCIRFKSYDLITSEIDTLLTPPLDDGDPVANGKFIYLIEEAFGWAYFAAAETKFTRYDTERMIWQAMRSVPSPIFTPNSIELKGLIYIAGQYRNFLTFWCYDPTRDEWAEKASFNNAGGHTPLFKMKQNICTFNQWGGFKMYDSDMNCWKTLEPILHGSIDAQDANTRSYLAEAIDFKDKTYGIWIGNDTRQSIVTLEPKSESCEITFPNSSNIDSKSKLHLFSSHT